MNKFIILDSHGARHATIKATTKKQALKKYLNREITMEDCLAFTVIFSDILNRFKSNVKFI